MKFLAGCGLNLLFWLAMIALGIWVLTQAQLSVYGAWLLALSIITFLTYGYDNWQGNRKGQRILPLAFHLLALLGGFLGGWFGMFFFDTKNKKDDRDYKLVLVIGTVLHFLLINRGFVEL